MHVHNGGACCQREILPCCYHIKLFPSLGLQLLISLVSHVFFVLRDVSIKHGMLGSAVLLNSHVSDYVSLYKTFFFSYFKLKTNPLKHISENEDLGFR